MPERARELWNRSKVRLPRKFRELRVPLRIGNAIIPPNTGAENRGGWDESRPLVQADAMKGSRTWNRRSFAVTANGFFTILKPAGWFATVRLPGGFRYLVGQSKGAASPRAHENPTENPTAAPPPESASVPERKALDHADSQESAIPSKGMIPSAHDHHLMRPALIVLAATAIPLIFLWLIHAHP
jgi:hypothetical protein